MYLGIDLGTSSLKVLLAKGGKIIDTESCGYPLSVLHDKWSEQNPEDWYNALILALKKLGSRKNLEQIKGISFCGQMHGLVVLDSKDNVIRPAILWNDNRTTAECDYLNNIIGKDNLINWTGNIAYTGFTAPKILWLKNNEPQNFNKISKIMLPKDYLAYKMSGVFASDVSDSSGTLYFDVANKCWSQPMLDVLGISKNQLPQIFESYEVIGNVTDKIADLTGLSKNAKVIIGGGDQAVGAIGTGTVDNNQFSISLGTSGVVFAASKQYNKVSSGAMHSFCHANGAYHIMGVMLSAAGSLNWWIKDILKSSDFTAILTEAGDAKAENLYFLPYLSGERSPINDPYAKGVFYGLTIAHTQADMTRAVLEGISFGLLDCQNSIKELGIIPQSAKVIGGGAKSQSWLQISADILEIELHTVNTTEGGGLGAVILAMTGCGEFESVSEGCKKLISDGKKYYPNIANAEKYHKKFETFKKLYQTTKILN